MVRKMQAHGTNEDKPLPAAVTLQIRAKPSFWPRVKAWSRTANHKGPPSNGSDFRRARPQWSG
jgi:hypothetical protein